VVEVSDDGSGLDVQAIKQTALKRKLFREEELAAMPLSQLHSLIFTQGFSTSPIVTDISGRGVGLDIVHANIENLKGSIQVESAPLIGTTFRLILPITLATARVLIVKDAGQSFAIPVEYIQTTHQVRPADIFTIEGHDTIVHDGQPVSVARLSKLIGLGNAPLADSDDTSHRRNKRSQGAAGQQDGPTWTPCIVLSVGSVRLGLLVDELVDEHEIILKPLGVLLKRVRNVSSAAVLGSGEICVVLNPNDLLKSLWKRSAPTLSPQPDQETERKLSLLLVEDSITTRTQEKRILEAGGYTVVTAVDGLDGWAKLAADVFDAVITDIQMPNMDGLALAAKIRQDKKYQEMPIILVTSLSSDEDKRKGIEVGANAYITKSSFDQQVLLDTVRRLV
jgi:two-component system, chemotaxis family, sensor kinase CheA